MIETGERRFVEEMKGPIERLQLQRKIVFVKRYAGIFLVIARHCGNSSVARIQILIWIQDRVTDSIRRVLGPVTGKIGADKSTFSGNHMALGTAGFPEKK